MRAFTAVLGAAALLLGRVSADACLTDSDANGLVSGFASLLTNYTLATAEALLAPDFTDTSDSINYMAGIPVRRDPFTTQKLGSLYTAERICLLSGLLPFRLPARMKRSNS